MQTSCAFLTLLVVALGSSPAFAQSAEQQRLDAIAREAARQFAEARTPLGGADAPHQSCAARNPSRVDARRSGEARARAQPGHRRRAAESADLRLDAGLPAEKLPADVQLQHRHPQPVAVSTQSDGRRRHARDRDLHRQQRHHAEREMGRGQLCCRLQQQPSGAVRPLRHAQPRDQREPHRRVRAAAPAQFPDRWHPRGAAHHRVEPGDVRDRVAGDHRADGGQHAQRVLGLRLRDSGARSRRPVAGAGHQARRGQPGARRSGHARPARCRPGAGRTGHATPGSRHGGDDRSHR